MTNVYIANFASIEDVDAERDDPSWDLELMASPQFFSMSLNHTRDWVDGVKDAAEEEWEYFGSENGTIEWDDGEWVTPPQGRRNRTLTASLDGVVIGKVIIQAEQLEGM